MRYMTSPFGLMCLVHLSLASIFLPASAQWVGATRDTLTHNGSRDETTPQSLVCDETNTLHVVWEQAVQTGGWRIFYSRRPVTGSWTPPREVGESTLVSYQAALTIEPVTRTAYVAFRTTYPTGDEIVIARDSAGGWQRIRLTNNNTSEYAPTIAADQNGKVHVVWIGKDALNNWKIFYAENLTGSWRTQLLAGSELGDFGSGAAPFVGVTSAGIAHIFYRGGDYPAYRIHHASNAQPGDSIWMYETVVTPNGADYTSRVVIDDAGTIDLLATGNDGFGFPPHAYYVVKPAGGQWSAPELANPGGAGSGGSLVIDQYGRAHITWDEVSGNIITGNLYYATNRSGNWRIAPVQIDAMTYNGVLAVDGTGNGHILAYNGATFQTQEIFVIHSNGPVTAIQEGAEEKPGTFVLFQNCPNPFNPVTTIEFRIGEFGCVKLMVFDVLGRHVATLVNEAREPGEHSVTWDASSAASGVYFCRLLATNIVQTRKMLLLK